MRAMLRRLFACLALLTGLAAAGAPAPAHMAEAQVARVEAGLYAIVGDPAATATARHQLGARDYAPVLPDRPTPLVSTLFAPAVHLGSDRARK